MRLHFLDHDESGRQPDHAFLYAGVGTIDELVRVDEERHSARTDRGRPGRRQQRRPQRR
jgi:hypothetical protein